MEEFALQRPILGAPKMNERPLLGLTILLVEDSRYFSDAVRLMAIRSGARLRRADCLHSARKHVRIYRPDAVLVDLGLPDGRGQDFITEISSGPSSPPIIAMSGETGANTQQEAIGAGAILYLQKPFFDLASFQQTVLSVLQSEDMQIKFKPRIAGEEVKPDDVSLNEDLIQIRTIICESVSATDKNRMKYCLQFLASVAQVSGDRDLKSEAEMLSVKISKNEKWKGSCDRLVELLDKRLAA